MAVLRRMLDDALSGAGSLCLLIGEEGIGKSRLADEVACEAQALGLHVRHGRCLPASAAPPLWPWRHALLGDGALTPPKEPPDSAQRCDGFAALLADEGERVEPGRFERLAAVVAQLGRLSAERPVLLLLDDLHLADGPSLELLRLLCLAVDRLPLLCIATSRPIGECSAPRGELWAALRREAQPMPLGGLDAEGAGALLEQLLPAPLPGERIAELAAFTDGNPYFLLGVARALLVEGGRAETPASGLPVPDDLRHAIRVRVEALPDAAQRLLRSAALLEARFDIGLAARAAGLPLDEQDPAARAALRDGLLRPSDDVEGQYTFRHPIVRQALVQDLGATARAELHLAIARAIEATHGSARDHLEALAHHFGAALPVGPLDRALYYLSAAAEHARQHLDMAAVVSHLARAAEWVEATEGGTARLGRLLIELGEAQRRLGRSEGARAACGRAMTIARALGEEILFAQAALGLGLKLDGFASTFAEDAAVLAALREALERLPLEEAALRARCLARLALELHHLSDLGPSREAATAALRLAEQLGDDRTLLVALHAHVLCHAGPDLPPADLLAAAGRIIDIAVRQNDREAEFHGHHIRVAASLAQGDRPALDLAIAACSRIVSEQRLQRCAWQGQVFLVMRALLDGRLADVADRAQAACDEGLPLVGQAAEEVLTTQTFDLLWALGRLGETAAAHLERAERYPQASAWTPGLVIALVCAGRRVEARAHFDRVMACGLGRIRRDELWLVTMALLGEAAARLGATEAAAELRGLLLPYHGMGIDIRFGRHFIGTVDRVLGLLAAALGLREEASAHFAAADALHVRLGAMRWLAEARCDHAEVLLTGGAADRARAEPLLSSALAIAQELGLAGAAARARALSDSAALRPAPDPGHAQEPLEGVFQRDGDGWLVGLGPDRVRLSHRKGLRYLAMLLARPGQTVHVLELGDSAAGADEAPRSLTTRRTLGDAGPAIDARTHGAYRQRLRELRAELQQAEDWADEGRRQRLEAEIAALSEQLTSAYGLRGPRRALAHSERQRKAVSKCIGAAIARIEASLPGLGRHLRRAIRVGVHCAYLPSTAVRWRL